MPINDVYYILLAPKSGVALKNLDGDVTLFPTRDDAHAKACDLRADNPDQHYLIEGPFTKDKLDWQTRERARLADGSHKPLTPELAQYCLPEHFAHVAKGDPGSLAYTKHEADAIRDIQKRMNVVAYLKLYAPALSAGQMCALQASHTRQVSDAELLLATTPEDIVEVYTCYDDETSGVGNSCMRYEKGYFQGSQHPVAAYGDSDLAVAYVKNGDGETTARTLVWPAKRCYSRLYGGERSTPELQRALLRAGYKASQGYYGSSSNNSEHSLVGARIRAVPDANRRGRYIVPYVDEGVYGEVDVTKTWITLRDVQPTRGCISLKETSGVAMPQGPRCPRCRGPVADESDFMSAYTTYPAGDETVQVCESCSFVCAGTQVRYSTTTVNYISVGGLGYAQEWAAVNLPRCSSCGSYANAAAGLVPARTGLHDGLGEICGSCAGTGFFWCEEAKMLTAVNLRVAALDVGARKKVTLGTRVRLIDRGYSILTTRAAERLAELHKFAMGEMESGAKESFLLFDPVGDTPLLNGDGEPKVYRGVAPALLASRSFYAIVRDTARARARVPAVGKLVRVLDCAMFPEAVGLLGRIESTVSGVYMRPYAIRLTDGREAFCGAAGITVLPEPPEGTVFVPRPDPQVGELVMFCHPGSPRFSQRGTVETVVAGRDGPAEYLVRFADGTTRRASAARIQTVDRRQLDLPLSAKDPTRPYDVGDRVRFTPACVEVSIPSDEIGKEGVIETVTFRGDPVSARSAFSGSLWQVRREGIVAIA